MGTFFRQRLAFQPVLYTDIGGLLIKMLFDNFRIFYEGERVWAALDEAESVGWMGIGDECSIIK